MHLISRLVFLASGVVVVASAHATGEALWIADGYNVFVRENFNGQNSDVEGKVAVGGNLNVTNYSFGEKLNGFTGDTLYVAGEFSYNNGQVFHGNAKTRDTTPTTSGFNALNGTLKSGQSADFWIPTVMTALVQRSGFIGGQAATGNTNFQFGGLTLSGGSGATRYYNVNASDLANANNFVIDAPNGTTVVVNVAGSAASFQNAGFSLTGGVTGSTVLLNFYQATTLSFAGIGMQANILAPQADVTFNSGAITGQLIANSFSGGGQMNLGNFNGAVPVPEPATMTALAIGGLGFLNRRRKKN